MKTTKRISQWLCFGAMLFCSFLLKAQSYSGGMGTLGDPYLISNVADLQQLAANVNNGVSTINKYFKQTADLDLSTVCGPDLGNWIPIGKQGMAFKGSYDGQGHKIRNLYINDTLNYQGLFGYVSEVTIQGVGLENCKVGGNHYVGGLVGYANQLKMNDCYVTGDISATYKSAYVGGVVGISNTGIISNCYYGSGTVSASGSGAYIGGFSGFNTGPITDCYSSGNVSYKEAVIDKSKVANIGGFVAQQSSDGKLNNCYVTGSISAEGSVMNVGGLVGDHGHKSRINACYVAGDISAKGDSTINVGSLVGHSQGGNISNSYSISSVNGEGKNTTVDALVGFFKQASLNGKVDNCYFNSEITSENTKNDFGIGKTTEEMKSPEMVRALNRGSKCGSWRTDSASIVNGGYPVSYWQVGDQLIKPLGIGTKANPYQITSPDELIWLSDLVMSNGDAVGIDIWITTGKYFKLMNDIDMNGFEFVSIGSEQYPFNGSFMGEGKVISNLKIEEPERKFVGLFGCTGPTALVEKLGLENCSILGNCYTGGLVGKNEGRVNSCYVSGNVSYITYPKTSTGYLGGLVGNNGGWLEKSFNAANLNAKGYGVLLGGVVGGNNEGLVENCYNIGNLSVEGNLPYIGGVAGFNYENSIIRNCYSRGTVAATWDKIAGHVGGAVGNRSTNNRSTELNIYYNKDTSSINMRNIGTGKTTEEMKSITFADSLNNQQNPIQFTVDQWPNKNVGYPILTWQNKVYIVKLDTKGGSDMADIKIFSGSLVPKPRNPGKTGYEFGGWFKEDSLKTEWDFEKDTILADRTLHAKWTIKQYTVKFESNEGSSIDSITLDFDNLISKPVDPTKTDYDFGGWFKEESLTNEWDFEKDKIRNNMTLYAKWTIKQYTVRFESNGGSSIDSMNVDLNNLISKPTDPTKTGYDFNGWFKEESLTNEWNFATDTLSSDTTLYAKWTIKNFTARFESNGGSSIDSISVDFNNLISKPIDPTKTGYDFNGWFKEASLTNEWDFATDKVLSDTTLYAKWTIKNLTVRFESNGGSSIDSVNVIFDNLISKPMDPTKTGYDFNGWFKEASLTNEWDFATDKVLSDTILYAKWKLNVGIEKIAASGLNVYPNPVQDRLYISNSETIQSIEVYDMLGKLQVRQVGNRPEVEMSMLRSGYYAVKVITEQGVYQCKIVKK